MASLERDSLNWFPVYTRPHQERRALSNLERQGFHCLLPEVRRPRSQRIEPLFPRYLFLEARPAEQSLAPIRSTRGVSGLVRFGERIATLPARVMQAIRARIDPATGLVQAESLDFRPGEHVRVLRGPLAGVEAIFRAGSGHERVLVLMELLGRQTTVEVDRLSLGRAV